MEIRNFTDVKSFLFDNTSIRQTIFKNTFWLALSSGVSRLFTFFLFIYVARILGATEYGKFTFALAFVLLFGVFSDLGLFRITIRELSQDKEKEKEYSNLLSLKLLLILGTLIAVFIGSFFITSDSTIQKVIWILAFYITLGNFTQIIYGFLQARQKMEYEAWAKILEAVLHVSFGFLVIFNFPSVENLAYGYLISVLVFLTFFLTFFHFKFYRLHFSWNTLIWRKYLKMSWPLAFAAFFSAIYSQIDTVMMGSSGQITQTGWYNAAYRIVAVTIIPATVISTSFFPVLNKAFKETKEKFQEIWNYHIEIMISLSIPLMIGGIVLAPKIIEYIFDPTFSPSILAFKILILMAGITIIYVPFYHSLIVSNQQKKIFLVVLLGAIINVILNLILIPRFSLYGAASTTVVTWLLILFLTFKFTLKFTSIRPLNFKIALSFIGAIFSTIPMYFIISQPQIYHLHILFSILIGAGVYLIFLYGYKKVINKLIFKSHENYFCS